MQCFLFYCCTYLFGGKSNIFWGYIINVAICGGILFTVGDEPVTIFWNKHNSSDDILVVDLEKCTKIAGAVITKNRSPINYKRIMFGGLIVIGLGFLTHTLMKMPVR